MADNFNDWLDGVLAGKPVDAGEFARSAIGELPRVTTPIRKLSRDIWPDLSDEEPS